MLKAEVTEKYTKVEIVGSLPTICADVAHILSAINERLTENSAELGHEFRVMLTKGYMDGVCFDDDREHMEHYLAEGDSRVKKQKTLQDAADDFLSFLNDKLEELKKFVGEDKKDEAE